MSRLAQWHSRRARCTMRAMSLGCGRRVLVWALGICAVVYGLVTVMLSFFSRGAIYPAPRDFPGAVPEDATLVDARAEDGARVNAFLFEPPTGAPVAVHFHGNGETIGHDVWIARELRSRGLGVLLVEYRGYGLSRREPPPSEPGLCADAAAALDALSARGIGPDRVVLLGQSLGTGIAAEMALRGRGRALVLITPYTSMLDLVRRYVPPLLPMRWIVSERFETLSKAPRITMPTLIIHGSADEIIPYDMGERLSKAFPHVEMYTLEGGHHNDLMMIDPDGIFGRIARIAGK